MSTSRLPPLYRTVVLVAGLVVIAAGMRAMAETVNIVLVAMLLAMTVTPIPDYLGRKGMKRGPAVLLTILGVLVAGVLLISALATSLAGMTQKLPVYQASLTHLINDAGQQLQARGIALDEALKPDTQRIMGFVGKVVRLALGTMGYGFLILILVILVLIEAPLMKRASGDADRLRERLHEVTTSVRRFVGLTGLIGAVQGALNLLAMLAVGTDFPVVWAVLFFLLNFVPFGFLIALVPPVIVTLLEQGPAQAGILFGIQFVVNLIVDNVVKPKVMGGGLGLSPFLIVVSLLVWSYILGAPGAVLAVPLTITLSRLMPHFTADPARA